MKRLTAFHVALVLTLTVSWVFGQDDVPPGPDDEWQQEEWTTAPPRRRRPRGFSGGAGMQGSTFGPAEFQQQMERMQSRFFDMQGQFADVQRLAEESKTTAIRQNLGVSDQQWTRIKPRLDRIEKLKAGAKASIEPGSYNGGSTFVDGGGNFGGTWSGGFTSFGSAGPGRSWSRTETFGPGGSRSTQGGTGELTPAENLCHELNDLLQNPGAAPAQIAQKVAALRRAKQRAQTQLQRERAQLRSQVNPRQEAALIVMGYLE
jgi:hypothetical protein